jgi:release factor glutamine methyltransferase
MKQETIGESTVEKIIEDSRNILKSISPTASLEAFILVGFVLRKTKEWLYAHPESPVTKKSEEKITKLVSKRKKRVPIAYLIGKKEFYGKEFKTTPQALIPRPETETLVDLALTEIKLSLKKKNPHLIVDLGTGSGCIVLSLVNELKNKKNIQFLALDISPKALLLAKENAQKFKLEKKINFQKSNLLSALSNKKWPPKSHLIIIANLPYLSYSQYLKTAPEVKKEPRHALFIKEKGFFLIKKTLFQVKEITKKNPSLLVKIFAEIDPSLESRIIKTTSLLFPAFKREFSKDLSRKKRFFILKN